MKQMSDEFRTLIGVVLYLSIRTRPDIATAVSILSRYTVTPTPFIMKCALCTGGISETNYSLRPFIQQGQQTLAQSRIFVDADYSGGETDCKSRTGWIDRLNGYDFTRNSRKKSCVSLFTTWYRG